MEKLLGFTGQVIPIEKPTTSETPAIEREFQRQLREQILLHFPDFSIGVADKQLLFDNAQLSLESHVFERTEHPNAIVYGLRLRLIHQRFFPSGIVDCLAGIGSTDAEAIESGARNYIGSVFSVMIEALSGCYEPLLNFRTQDSAL